MNLQDIRGSYDSVFSLGSACNPALQFQRLNLKRFTSSPLDW
ncbi:peptidase, partial [Priestia aryabhattai]